MLTVKTDVRRVARVRKLSETKLGQVALLSWLSNGVEYRVRCVQLMSEQTDACLEPVEPQEPGNQSSLAHSSLAEQASREQSRISPSPHKDRPSCHLEIMLTLSRESTQKSQTAHDRVSHWVALQITDKEESFYIGITISKHISHVHRWTQTKEMKNCDAKYQFTFSHVLHRPWPHIHGYTGAN